MMDYAVVVVKGTFDIRHDGFLDFSGNQSPIHFADVFNGEEGFSSVRYESDCALKKASTDIVVNGFARTPDEHLCKSLDVCVQVGHLQVTRRVFGDRQWARSTVNWIKTEPQPFSSIPLTYENAYGGICEIENSQTVFCESNPIGKGFFVSSHSPPDDLYLPNIENPAQLIDNWKQQPSPVGFGFIAPGWSPRKHYAGTYNKEWQQQRAPLLPKDFDDIFYNAAHPDLMHYPKLGNGENVHINNVRHDGPLFFTIPTEKIKLTISRRGSRETYATTLDTLTIEPDERLAVMVWRAAIPTHRKLLDIDWISVKGNY